MCDDSGMKSHPEMIEGPEAWTRFDALVCKVMSTPHAEIKKRIEAERKASELNPHRRGPKRKPSVSPGPAASPQA
jgi:hypothetical protein